MAALLHLRFQFLRSNIGSRLERVTGSHISSFVVLCFVRMYVQHIWKNIESKCFYGGKDKKPFYVEASHHKPNPGRVCAAGISCAVWRKGDTDMKEKRQNRKSRKGCDTCCAN